MPNLTAAAVTRIVRKATGSDLFTSRLERSIGVVRVSQQYAVAGALTPGDTSDRREARARLAADALLQAGYEVTRSADRLTVTLPAEETDEPVIVRAGQAAPLAEQEAPLQGEVRVDERGARYWTAEEVAADRPDSTDPIPAGCDCSAAPGPHLAHCDDCSAPADACVCDLVVDDDPREQPAPVEWSEDAAPAGAVHLIEHGAASVTAGPDCDADPVLAGRLSWTTDGVTCPSCLDRAATRYEVHARACREQGGWQAAEQDEAAASVLRTRLRRLSEVPSPAPSLVRADAAPRALRYR